MPSFELTVPLSQIAAAGSGATNKGREGRWDRGHDNLLAHAEPSPFVICKGGGGGGGERRPAPASSQLQWKQVTEV